MYAVLRGRHKWGSAAVLKRELTVPEQGSYGL
jgi:hypothetical protein